MTPVHSCRLSAGDSVQALNRLWTLLAQHPLHLWLTFSPRWDPASHKTWTLGLAATKTTNRPTDGCCFLLDAMDNWIESWHTRRRISISICCVLFSMGASTTRCCPLCAVLDVARISGKKVEQPLKLFQIFCTKINTFDTHNLTVRTPRLKDFL